ncbi:tautomerase family protein [Novosphingobium rosa]|uniref:tautomerase family protein n=1 Tax=Novosphingobium rosa TaxID=76978 RepID=UPI00083442A9|nr:tautomerase family protein [Novosphingobium rosa]
MPHVVIKTVFGHSDAEKQDLTDKVTAAVMAAFDHEMAAVSVAIEEVHPDDWMDKVYEPEIMAKQASLSRRPGYGPLA